jgi:hypothetical protein
MLARISKLIDIRDTHECSIIEDEYDLYNPKDRAKCTQTLSEVKFKLNKKSGYNGFSILLAPEIYSNEEIAATVWNSKRREFLHPDRDSPNGFSDLLWQTEGNAPYALDSHAFIDYLFNILDPKAELPYTIKDIEHPNRLDYVETN